MVLASIAVIGKEHNPLYIRAFSRSQQDQSEESLLRFHFIVHTALDFVEDKIAAQRNAAQGSSSSSGPKLDPYLGLLYPIEDLRVYGYASTSKVKFIAVLDDEDVKDAQMNAFFRRLHGLYVDTVCNPFHPPNTELYDCAKFQRQVDRLVDAGLY
ncbi:hypothetical protein AB1Y20_021004 [Prymnesium parvum]|uniref:Trafficking protein particle complex subunit 2-like protein n=1 Tax=Prymnesium parvum TaxID=97485 RepID=A0AB34JJ56_PRYPA|mmetsp:Transcript_29456/g.73639  ORF Transcript_29456/g.73639 Transcript_29456/m.73639 type:complete len:155 (+) Transcript_29456:21-485(+)